MGCERQEPADALNRFQGCVFLHFRYVLDKDFSQLVGLRLHDEFLAVACEDQRVAANFSVQLKLPLNLGVHDKCAEVRHLEALRYEMVILTRNVRTVGVNHPPLKTPIAARSPARCWPRRATWKPWRSFSDTPASTALSAMWT